MTQRSFDSEILPSLCDPDTRNSFEPYSGSLRNPVSGRVYPVREGIPLFVSTVSGSNLKMQSHYDRVARFYDLTEGFKSRFGSGVAPRKLAVEALDVKSGMRMLDVGIGTGRCVPHIPRGVEICGIDLSIAMLRQCARNLRRMRRPAHLFQAVAERLPFCPEVFDRVLNVGGIGKFNDPLRAVREMTWVVRPGGKIVIVDQLEGASASTEAGANPAEQLIPLVPAEMVEINATMLDNAGWFCLSFRKPHNS